MRWEQFQIVDFRLKIETFSTFGVLGCNLKSKI